MNSKKILTSLTALCLTAQPLLSATEGLFRYRDEGTSITIINYPENAVGAVVIPAKIIGKPVTSIGEAAFNFCDRVTSFSIPESVTSIGVGAFLTNKSLTAITVDALNPNFSSVDGVLFNKNKTELINYPEKKMGDYTIPNSVTKIGDYAFTSCGGLTSVSIPDSVTSIGDLSFLTQNSLTGITVDALNPNYSSSNGVLFDKNKSVLIVYPAGKTGGYTIPDSVTSIGDFTFFGCTGLRTVLIPNSVTSLGDYAFSHCGGLTRIYIGSGVTSLGQGAFSDCVSLNQATFLGNAPAWGPDVFSDDFYDTPSKLTFYYLNGNTGFTTPRWNGRPCFGVDSLSEIVVQVASGSRMVDGEGQRIFGRVAVGMTGTVRRFTIRNTGITNLKNLAITKDGPHARNYIVSDLAKTSLAPGGTTTFKVTFTPSTTGFRNAAIHITSNDSDESPFDIKLIGYGEEP